MVNKITTPPTQNEVIDKINELVDDKQDVITSSNKLSASLVSGLATVATSGSYNDLSNKPSIPSVDQTYNPTSTNAQSGTAVSSAIGNGSVTINQGGTPRGTFTMNQSSNLTIDLDGTSGVSAIAILNKNTASPYQTLGIWQGTEYQWNHDIKTWYNWLTNPTANIEFLTNSTIPFSADSLDTYIKKYEIVYGNGIFLTAAGDTYDENNRPERRSIAAFTTNNARSWSNSSFQFTYTRTNDNGDRVAYGDGIWLYNQEAYTNLYFTSTDNGATFTLLPIANRPGVGCGCMKYCNDRFIVINVDSTTSLKYSNDSFESWQSSTLPKSTTWNDVAYGNGIYFVVGNGAIAYSTDNCATWQSATPPRTANWTSIIYGDGKFVIAAETGKGIYTTDVSNWQTTTDDLNGIIKYGSNMFVVASSTTVKYSSNLGTWSNVTIPDNNYYPIIGMEYGDGHFIIMARYQNSTTKRCFDLTFDSKSCYTLEEIPDTTSTVYSAPETASALTVSSTTSGAITLSDNNTYYYNQSGNVQTYQTVGDAHPEYLCFIDGVGVKMGNTFIATNNSNNS